MSIRSRRTMLVAVALALAGALGACMHPTHGNELTVLGPALAQPSTDVVLVVMPVPRPDRAGITVHYDAQWAYPPRFRQPFYKRMEENFAANGIKLQVLDVSMGGRAKIEPTALQIRATAEQIQVTGGQPSFWMRSVVSHGDTRLLSFVDWWPFGNGHTPANIADSVSRRMLNSLREAKLVPPPADGERYVTAPKPAA